MTDHTPEPCGCRIEWAYSDTHPPIIHYCPIHAAAPDLLAALERIETEDGTSIVPGVTESSAVNRLLYVKDVARAAIAKARGTDA